MGFYKNNKNKKLWALEWGIMSISLINLGNCGNSNPHKNGISVFLQTRISVIILIWEDSNSATLKAGPKSRLQKHMGKHFCGNIWWMREILEIEMNVDGFTFKAWRILLGNVH